MDLAPERSPLSVAELWHRLQQESGLWTDLVVVPETGSTNTDLVAAARAGASEGMVLVAEHQRSGRGRAGREWTSRPGAGLAVSMLLRPGVALGRWPEAPATRWGWLPLLAGVALAEAVTEQAGLAAFLKWPNDLLVRSQGGEAKCAGILAEVAGAAVVVGIGLNVTLRADELPPAVPDALPVTSLALAGATNVDRSGLLLAVLRRTEHWYRAWRARRGDAEACGLRAAYLRSCVTAGQSVRASLPGGTRVTGEADTVDSEGRLVVRTALGTRALAAGDITHVRRTERRPRD